MKNNKEFYANFRDARLIEVIKVEVNEGAGTLEDPMGRVVYLLNPKNGKVLAKLFDSQDRKFAGEDPIHLF